MSTKTYPLCPPAAIPEHGARGFGIDTPDGRRKLLLIRQDNRIHAYVNRCPHTGVNLDWVPDRFLDSSGHYLQCATHGALFRIHDGFCVHGPCAGQSLQPVSVEQHDGKLYALL